MSENLQNILALSENKDKYSIRLLCKCVGIHHSVYYYHCSHQENSYHIANKKLDEEIKIIYYESKCRYGSPKITKVLKNKDINVSQKRVAKRMRVLNLRSITIKKFNHSGNTGTDNSKEYPNLLEQHFKASSPGEKFNDVTSSTFTKNKFNNFIKVSLQIYIIISAIITILISIFINIFLGLFILGILILCGFIYYWIVSKICKW